MLLVKFQLTMSLGTRVIVVYKFWVKLHTFKTAQNLAKQVPAKVMETFAPELKISPKGLKTLAIISKSNHCFTSLHYSKCSESHRTCP